MSKRQQKKEIREKVITKRNKLSEEYRKQASEKIRKQVLELDEFKSANTIMSFVSFSSEVDTRKLIEKFWENSKRVIVPLAIVKTKELKLYEISKWEQLKPGVYGILEPIEDESRSIDPNDVDLVINPGVAFDKELNRVGYGGGFYDRFYHKLREDCIRVAIGFDIQIISEIPTNKYDIPVDMLITEKRIISKK